MNKLEAKIILLESDLQAALSHLEFLYGCLTSDHYRFAYPEQSAKTIEKARAKHPRTIHGCYHSGYQPDCEGCREGRAHRELLMKAELVMSLKDDLPEKPMCRLCGNTGMKFDGDYTNGTLKQIKCDCQL